MTITAIAGLAKEVEANQSVAKTGMTRILAAIKNASQKTGVDFAYLVNKAAQESGFRSDVKAKTSSATGLYQFTEQTWLQMLRDNGSKYGVGGLSDKIETRADGKLTVRDGVMRRQILELRKNPELSAAMAAELAQDNKDYLANNVGGAIGRTELYMAHFLGAGGASSFLQALHDNPAAKAANLLPEAAAANRGVFYGDDGTALSVMQIYNRFAAKMEGKGVDLPDEVTYPPAMLAVMGQTLNNIPDLKLPASSMTLAGLNADSGGKGISSISMSGLSTSGFGGETSAAALFSTMVLAQLDMLPGNHLSILQNQRQDERRDMA